MESVGTCAGDFRRERRQVCGAIQKMTNDTGEFKIDPRNTLRGMKTKETIFLK